MNLFIVLFNKIQTYNSFKRLSCIIWHLFDASSDFILSQSIPFQLRQPSQPSALPPSCHWRTKHFQINQTTRFSVDLAALVRDAVVEGEPHEQVLRRRRRVVVVLPQNTLCQPHGPLDGPVRRDHHPDPPPGDLHLLGSPLSSRFPSLVPDH